MVTRATTVRQGIKEPVSQRLRKGQTASLIIDQHLSDQVKHVLNVISSVLLKIIGDVVQQRFAVLPDKLTTAAAVVPIQPSSLEEPDPCVLRHLCWNMSQDPLHHGKMFPVLVGREQCPTKSHLINDTSNGPDITGLGPTQLEDDLRSAIVTRGHDQGVMFMVKRGRAKVNQPNLRILDNIDPVLQLAVRVAKEYIFWL